MSWALDIIIVNMFNVWTYKGRFQIQVSMT